MGDMVKALPKNSGAMASYERTFMNTASNHGTAVARREGGTFSTFISGDAVKRKINEIIGGQKGTGFITSIVSAVSTNPALAECDHGTILSAGMQGAALDLSPSQALGHFYMVPYKDNKNQRMVAQFQIGFKGYIQLAIRSGQYRRINVVSIKEGELVNYNRLTEELFTKLIEDDDIREATPTIGYYAMFELMNGFIKTMYWSKEKMEKHADKYSAAFKLDIFKKIAAGQIAQSEMWKYSSFWYKDFEGMAYKTMLRQLLSKWGVMSIEMQTAMVADMGVIDQNGQPDYIDNDHNDIVDAKTVEEEKPTYPQDMFDADLKKWTPLMNSGKKTPEQIITTAISKYPLTEEQKKAVHTAAGKPAGKSESAELASKATIEAIRDMAADMAVPDSDIHEHLGTKTLDGISVEQAEAARKFLNGDN